MHVGRGVRASMCGLSVGNGGMPKHKCLVPPQIPITFVKDNACGSAMCRIWHIMGAQEMYMSLHFKDLLFIGLTG